MIQAFTAAAVASGAEGAAAAAPLSSLGRAAASAAVDSPGGMPARLRAGGAGLPPPPYSPLIGFQIGSFAHATITARLPAILESMIKDVELHVADRALLPGWDATAEAQAAAGLGELRRLRQAMLDDAPLGLLHLEEAPQETTILLESANACVELGTARQRQQVQQQEQQQPEAAEDGTASAAAAIAATPRPTWLGLSWLLVECYMYAAIHAALQRQPALAGLDPFSRQKAAAWAKSVAAAADMAAEVELLRSALLAGGEPLRAADTTDSAVVAEAAAEAAKVRAAALAGISMALWGNKADLSLLVNAAGLDAGALAAVPPAGAAAAPSASLDRSDACGGSAAAPTEPPARVIVDDTAAVWATLERLRQRRASGGDGGDGRVRIDIVLDNSGLELFADLCLADLLTAAGVADRVVLHGKPIAWFVSDTLAEDLEALLVSCDAADPPSPLVSNEAWAPVRRAAARWRSHLAAGAWRWEAHPFWCTPAPFCWMAATAPDLYGSLADSDLVVFKGDLNYRKLAHDCRWPHTTPFEEALQGFRPAPLVALRTLKADVVVGLVEGQSERLSAADPDWLVNGKWGMIQAAL